jgi:predicted peptidase
MTIKEAKEEMRQTITTINDILKDPINTDQQRRYLTGKLRGYEYGQYLLLSLEKE